MGMREKDRGKGRLDPSNLRRGEGETRDKGEKTETQWLCLESCFQATLEAPGTLVYTSLQPGLN